MDDAAALAGAIRRVLADPSLATRLAEQGRRLSARYGEDEMVAAFLDRYERLASPEAPHDRDGGNGR
jgi:hypothetical protein